VKSGKLEVLQNLFFWFLPLASFGLIELRVFKPMQLYFKQVFSIIQTFQAAIVDILVK
jgi:hypothetical protein